MPRYRLTVEYDGAGFVGWQRQDSGLSVQAALEEAVRRFCGETAAVHGAGRTDAGVHARGQVCHLDLGRPVSADTLRDAVNAHLRPAAVAVVDARPAAPGFHARFSATRRHYRYRIVNRRPPLALERGRAWHVAAALDRTAMAAAAAHLVGRHDFSSFRAAGCQSASAVKTLDRLGVAADDGAIVVTAEARSFLYRQVRIMVGTLVRIGLGKAAPASIPAIFAARDRAAAGPTAPPCGLCLVAVSYGEPGEEPDTAAAPPVGTSAPRRGR